MKKGAVITDVEVVDIAAKGKSIAKKDAQVFLVDAQVPGDIIDVRVLRKKKKMTEAQTIALKQPSPHRVPFFCQHFEHCGGCRWQHMDYQAQLDFKHRQVCEQLRRLSGMPLPAAGPILGSEKTRQYRNKLEFTFSEQRWLTPEEIQSGNDFPDRLGLGFHVPGRFDQVLDVTECHLMDGIHNDMRNFLRDEAKRMDISFYHPREQHGDLRNVFFRNNRQGDWMMVLVASRDTEAIRGLMAKMNAKFPLLRSMHLVVNEKKNDSIQDLQTIHVSGEGALTEVFDKFDREGEQVRYKISPKSFFQTNPSQAERLYHVAATFAGLQPHETVYDLYTGTGSIALYVAHLCQKVIGVEYVEDAVADARENAALNGITNAAFYAGDMQMVLNDAFIRKHGQPDVVITDPPRAGMHADVVQKILEMAPSRIVYVSCDPATQARDMGLMKDAYTVEKIQPVDMFPHTGHVENVVLLRRNNAQQPA